MQVSNVSKLELSKVSNLELLIDLAIDQLYPVTFDNLIITIGLS